MIVTGTASPNQALLVRTGPTPSQVAAAVKAAWKGNRFTSPAGGGVSIRAQEALTPENLQADDGGKLAGLREDLARRGPTDRWWWD